MRVCKKYRSGVTPVHACVCVWAGGRAMGTFDIVNGGGSVLQPVYTLHPPPHN